LNVKEDVIIAESSNYSFDLVDFRLKKLNEHLQDIRNSEHSNSGEISKDQHYILSLVQYISDAQSKMIILC
jgi:hypothetical protein